MICNLCGRDITSGESRVMYGRDFIRGVPGAFPYNVHRSCRNADWAEYLEEKNRALREALHDLVGVVDTAAWPERDIPKIQSALMNASRALKGG